MKVGFIGLGAMGRGMALNLVKAGFSVTVWNRSEEPVKALVEAGAREAKKPSDAAKVDVLISMLADDGVAHKVLLDGGVIDAMKKGTVHVNMASVSVAFGRAMAQLHARMGLGYVAAPVLGRPDVAAAGKLNIIAAGERRWIDKAQPLLEAMGQKVWPVGEAPERANVVKVGANFMLASAIEAMAEASTLTRAYGVSAQEFLDIVTNTLFASPAYQGYGKAIAEEKFEPAGFKMTLGYKDVGLALSAAGDERVPLPLAGVVRDRMLDAIANGDGDKDWAGLAAVAARHAHLDRRDQRGQDEAGESDENDDELEERSERTSWLRRSAKSRRAGDKSKTELSDVNDTAEQVDTREEPVKEQRPHPRNSDGE